MPHREKALFDAKKYGVAQLDYISQYGTDSRTPKSETCCIHWVQVRVFVSRAKRHPHNGEVPKHSPGGYIRPSQPF
jgi:hypothetical protein